MSVYFTAIFFFVCSMCNAQVMDSVNTNTEQQLESITANNGDIVTEDDAYLQELRQFESDPVNLNTADESLCAQLRILNPVQIINLISYRSLLGPLISIYELQALPGWDIRTISSVRPYITVSVPFSLRRSLAARLKGGASTLLLRATQVLERSKGYLSDSTKATDYYLGSPQRLMVRYKYNYKNLLQYGVVAEKDPGEQFFKGKQHMGFDFYSAHLFIKNLGIIRSLALGDYSVNLGQGLIEWQSLAFKKGPEVLSVKRESTVLRPYNSSGEINFHRGIGLTLGRKNWEATAFGSFRNIDANYVADTVPGHEEFISSLQISGYHRTPSETADKSVQQQIAFGGNVAFRSGKLHIGINTIQYNFKYPIRKDDQPYNRLAPAGKHFGNYSADYSYTFRNLHLFGEAAVTDKKQPAFVNGLLISTAANVNMSFLYRNISPGYQALNGNAFTENTLPTNEKGLFSGISIKLNPEWQIDAYADMYKFPGIKFRVNAPSTGSDYLVQLTYRAGKQFEVYTLYKKEIKGINYNMDSMHISPVIYQPHQSWRAQVDFQLNAEITVRSRAEMVWFNKKEIEGEQGFLLYADIFYKPRGRKYAANMRTLYFETDGYNSRMYTFESDLLYSYSVPVFYDKGYRCYINLNYDISRKLSTWIKAAMTVYPDKETIGSGLDEIPGNHKTELKFQLLYKF